MPALSGRYRLDQPIALGGTAVVWRAHDLFLNRDVAVKAPISDLSTKQSVANFQAEAKFGARLSHPNVATVYDCGTYRRRGRRTPYLVMELLDGVSLGSRLDSGLSPSPADSISICAQVAAALAAAHARGVVHCDVKPDNIMLTSNGVKVVDFGIASTGSLRSTDCRYGTPAYMAPEQLADGTCEPAGDVYALGVTLYRCLTGALPWSGSTLTELMANRRDRSPVRIGYVPGVSAEIVDLCLKCLSDTPSDRPASKEVAEILGHKHFSVELPETARLSTTSNQWSATIPLPNRLGAKWLVSWRARPRLSQTSRLRSASRAVTVAASAVAVLLLFFVAGSALSTL